MSLIITVANTTFTFTRKRGRPSNTNRYDSVKITAKRGRPVGSKNKQKLPPKLVGTVNSKWAKRQNEQINQNIALKLAHIEKLKAMAEA